MARLYAGQAAVDGGGRQGNTRPAVASADHTPGAPFTAYLAIALGAVALLSWSIIKMSTQLANSGSPAADRWRRAGSPPGV